MSKCNACLSKPWACEVCTVKEKPIPKVKPLCKKCQKLPAVSKGLCRRCYSAQRQADMKTARLEEEIADKHAINGFEQWQIMDEFRRRLHEAETLGLALILLGKRSAVEVEIGCFIEKFK